MTERLPWGDFLGKWVHFQAHIGYHFYNSDLDIKAKTNMLSSQT